MRHLYDKAWINITVAFTVLVIVIGFPVFQCLKGFPESLFWTLAVVLGVWLTYLIRAYFWSRGDNQ